MKKHKFNTFGQQYDLHVQRQCRVGVGLLVLCLLSFLWLVLASGCAAPKQETATAPPSVQTVHEKVVIPFAYDSADPIVMPALFEAHYDSISIEGHADARGPEAYNYVLSWRRAATVEQRIRGLGVLGEISVGGYGKREPLCYDSTESCHARNRRVVVKTTKRSHAAP